MPSAVEECREPSGKCQEISHCMESGQPELLKKLENLLNPRGSRMIPPSCPGTDLRGA